MHCTATSRQTSLHLMCLVLVLDQGVLACVVVVAIAAGGLAGGKEAVQATAEAKVLGTLGVEAAATTLQMGKHQATACLACPG